MYVDNNFLAEINSALPVSSRQVYLSSYNTCTAKIKVT